MKTAMALVRGLITGSYNLVDLLGERDSAVAKLAAARDEIVRLEAQRLSAESFEGAEEINHRLARVQWTVDQINDALLPALEQRIVAARAAKQRAALLKHQAAARALYPKLRAAVEAAGRVQSEAIAARNAAIAELGESLVSVHVPIVAFRGLLLEDLIQMWVAEQDRVHAAPTPAPQPAVAVVVKPVPARPAAKPVVPAAPAEPVALKPPKRREPRRDKVAPNGRLVTLMRSGVELPDGTQGLVGDVVAMLATDAERLVMSGAGDYFTSAS
jgi:hypothetical protein